MIILDKCAKRQLSTRSLGVRWRKNSWKSSIGTSFWDVRQGTQILKDLGAWGNERGREKLGKITNLQEILLIYVGIICEPRESRGDALSGLSAGFQI